MEFNIPIKEQSGSLSELEEPVDKFILTLKNAGWTNDDIKEVLKKVFRKYEMI